MFKDADLLRLADEADDEVSLCEQVSRRHGLELDLDQATKLMRRAQSHCIVHFKKLSAAEGCIICERPES
jgi:hypothetical protein